MQVISIQMISWKKQIREAEGDMIRLMVIFDES